MVVMGLVICSLVGVVSCVEEAEQETPATPQERTEESTRGRSTSVERSASGGKVKETTDIKKGKEVVLQALKKVEEAKGYHFESKFTIAINQADGKNVFKISCTMKEGIHLRPDVAYGKFEAMGHKSEVYQKGNKVAAKGVKSDRWVKGNPAAYPLPSEQWEILKEYLEDAEFSGKETLKDKECQVVKVSIKLEGLIKMLKKLNISRAGEETPVSSYKIWIGEKDSFIYKLFSSMEIPHGTKKKEPKEEGPPGVSSAPPEKEGHKHQELTRSIINEIDFFDYNKDIDIKIPAEVKKLLENGEEKEGK